MIGRISIFLFAVSVLPVRADIIVPNRTLRAGDLLTAETVRVVAGVDARGFNELDDVVGQEARVALYVNRPILFDQIGPPALIERNQIVQIKFAGSQLIINTEGRALERGGVGDRVKIMNLSSRATIFGFVQPDGYVEVYR
ncbi:MAG: flagellar basal body P-ring formation chaperone FlgA [Lentilitoribacter sp.]